MLTSRSNPTVKALSSAVYANVQRIARLYGENSPAYRKALFEYELAVRSSDSRPDKNGVVKYHNMPFSDICGLFSRKVGGHCGATKRTHTHHPDGWELEFFVVKRYKYHGCDFAGHGSGNQLIDEIKCWLKLQSTDDADFLCPIFKFETAKSDNCKALSDTMKERVCIIAQKAVDVSDLAGACEIAYRRNKAKGIPAEDPAARRNAMLKFAERMGWWDVRHNPGNSGVVFDHAKGCYKAVFIDYAL